MKHLLTIKDFGSFRRLKSKLVAEPFKMSAYKNLDDHQQQEFMKPKKQKMVTINKLVEETHADCRHVKKWIELEGVPSRQSGGRTVFEHDAAVAVIREHQKRKEHDESEAPALEAVALHRNPRREVPQPCAGCELDFFEHLIPPLEKFGLNEDQVSEILDIIEASCPACAEANASYKQVEEGKE